MSKLRYSLDHFAYKSSEHGALRAERFGVAGFSSTLYMLLCAFFFNLQETCNGLLWVSSHPPHDVLNFFVETFIPRKEYTLLMQIVYAESKFKLCAAVVQSIEKMFLPSFKVLQCTGNMTPKLSFKMKFRKRKHLFVCACEGVHHLF